MKNKILILVCFLIVLSGIGIVSATTVTGALGTGDVALNTYNYGINAISTVEGPISFNKIQFGAFEFSSHTKSIIFFTNKSSSGGQIFYYVNGTLVSGQSPFTAAIGATPVGNGTIGYYRVFTGTPPVEQSSYVWLLMDNWNVGVFTGAQSVTISYNNTETKMNGAGVFSTRYATAQYGNIPTANPYLYQWTSSGYTGLGDITYNREVKFINEYTATTPSGIGITGYVNKTIGGTTYPSQVFIINAATGTALSSEYTLDGTDYEFQTPASEIYIAIKSDTGVFYNTSTLFSAPTPTPTPTPTTTIPPGYVQSHVHVVDQNGNAIHGANIYLYDNEAAVWANSTSDSDGVGYINTLPYHTIDILADFTIFENELLPNSLLDQQVGLYGAEFVLGLYPWETGAEEGQTTLYVEVRDKNTHIFIPYSVVTATALGQSYSQSTGTGGRATFLLTNNTNVRVETTATGYYPATGYTNTGPTISKTFLVELDRITITPTPTTGGTVVVTVGPYGTPGPYGTYAPGYVGNEAQKAMDFLAGNALSLVQLCFVVTILALLGFKLGK